MRSILLRTSVCAAGALAFLTGGAVTVSPTKAQPPSSSDPMPTPPSTTLSTSVVDAAAAYQSYVRQASTLPSTFADGAQVQSEMQAGESFGPSGLARGEVAFAAVV